MFLIDVKGPYRRNPWPMKRKAVRRDLYYVLSFVPDSGSNRFFVLTQEQANTYIDEELKRLGRPDTYPITGITWALAEKHENEWHILPQ